MSEYRFKVVLVVFVLVLLTDIITSVPPNQYVWGAGYLTALTSPTPSYQDYTFQKVFNDAGSPIVGILTNGTVLQLNIRAKTVESALNNVGPIIDYCSTKAGISSTFVGITSTGKVYGWGYRAGDGSEAYNTPMVQVQGLLSGKVAVKCACSSVHVVILTNDNQLYSWGSNNQGWLGNGQSGPNLKSLVPVAVDMSALNGVTITDIVCRDSATFVLGSNGRVYGYGTGNIGISGVTEQKIPAQITWTGALSGKSAKKVIAKSSAIYILTTDNLVFGFGSNNFGELGLGHTIDQATAVPMKLTPLGSSTVLDVISGLSTVYILTNDNKLFAAGSNSNNRISSSTTSMFSTLSEIVWSNSLPNGVSIANIFTSNLAQGILGSDSKLYMWGNAESTGRVFPSIPYNPVVEKETFNTSNVKQLHTGSHFMIAVTNENKLYSWGYNYEGQLGNGNLNPSGVPFEIDIGAVVSKVLAAQSSAYILTTEGKVYGWGLNNYGQLTGGAERKLTPTLIDGGASLKVIKIAVSGDHVLVLTEDNLLYSWGRNEEGQLGDGTTYNRFSPVAVSMTAFDPKEKVIEISVGLTSSVALTNKGNVYQWGYHVAANDMSSASIPFRLPTSFGQDKIVKIYGGDQIIGRTKSGKYYGWGQNTAGQLGINSTTSQYLPVPVVIEGTSLEGKKIVHISVGEYQTFAITSDGLLHFWGAYSYSGTAHITNQLVAQLVDLSNVPAGQKPTFLSTFSGSLRGMVVGSSLPVKFCDDLICGEPSCYGNITFPCSGNGVCVGLHDCQCYSNFTGDQCDIPVCYGDLVEECSGHGDCVAVDQCVCSANYTGLKCENPICSENTQVVCNGHGSCIAPNTCQCYSNYTGTKCQTPVCYGNTTVICSGHGDCVAVNQCVCDDEYTGQKCSISVWKVSITLKTREFNTTVIKPTDFSVKYGDTPNDELVYHIQSVTGGYFVYLNARDTPIANFTQQDIIDGLVGFVHNGGNSTLPSVSIRLTTTVNFETHAVSNDELKVQLLQKIKISVFNLEVKKGKSVVLTEQMLSTSDTQTPPEQIVFQVKEVQHGRFELVSDKGTPITSFTQKQINDGQVVFVHDNSDEEPTISFIVGNGDTTNSQEKVNVPVNASVEKSKSKGAIIGAVLGAILGAICLLILFLSLIIVVAIGFCVSRSTKEKRQVKPAPTTDRQKINMD